MSQGFEKDCVGLFWLRVTHEVANKMSVGAAVNESLTGAGIATARLADPHGCWQEACSLSHEPLHRAS